MKKVLITGKNSYVGNKFQEWLANYPDKYTVEKISLRDNLWKNLDFSQYDVIFHVAGIAHVSSDPKMKDLYYKINRDLTVEIAIKAKEEGVKQFIFMSSIIVYGNSSNYKNVINKNTVPTPSDFYGDSKFQAEIAIRPLEDSNFQIVILRPPMIYGIESKGNYPKLAKLAKKLPIFPMIDNERSMLYIENLCEFIKKIIDKDERGIFYPQNLEYVSTTTLFTTIREVQKKQTFTPRIPKILMCFFMWTRYYKKVFGNLVYDKKMSNYNFDYQIKSFYESIATTENGTNSKKHENI